MRTRFKFIPAILVALLLMLAVACGGDGGNGDSSSSDPVGSEGDPSDELVLSAVEQLGRSADDFQTDVTSLQGTMAMDMSVGETSFGLGSDFAFQSPDRMHMTMEFTGGEGAIIDLSQLGNMEILLIGEDIYINMAFLGGSWVKASLDDLGVDADQFREILSDQSPFDYSALIEGLGGDVQVQDLGIEDIDGHNVHHYRISSDFQNLMEAMSGAFGDDLTGNSFSVDEISGPVVVDLLLDTTTLLPYKVDAKGSFVVEDSPVDGTPGNLSFTMSIVIEDYNGEITFPDPPTDAIDIADFGDDILGTAEE